MRNGNLICCNNKVSQKGFSVERDQYKNAQIQTEKRWKSIKSRASDKYKQENEWLSKEKSFMKEAFDRELASNRVIDQLADQKVLTFSENAEKRVGE